MISCWVDQSRDSRVSEHRGSRWGLAEESKEGSNLGVHVSHLTRVLGIPDVLRIENRYSHGRYRLLLPTLGNTNVGQIANSQYYSRVRIP